MRLVFTRVIPLEQDPSSHPLWRLAESFGATCAINLDAATTHVIAGASGTEKVCSSRRLERSRLPVRQHSCMLGLNLGGRGALHAWVCSSSMQRACCRRPHAQVLTARQMGKWVVTPAWLECSCILWKRANEDRFLVPL